jgi:hypothetical protein
MYVVPTAKPDLTTEQQIPEMLAHIPPIMRSLVSDSQEVDVRAHSRDYFETLNVRGSRYTRTDRHSQFKSLCVRSFDICERSKLPLRHYKSTTRLQRLSRRRL